MNHRGKQIFFIISALAVLAAPAYTQILGSVKGIVTEKKSKAPLEKVKVTIVSTRASSIKFDMVTDKQGYFYKSGLRNGTYDVYYQKEGHIPIKLTFRLRIGQERDLSIQLEAVKQKLSAPSNLLKKSVDLINTGKYEQALENINKLFEKNPNNEVLFYYRAFIYDKKGDKDKAMSDFKKSIALKPDFILPLNSLGKLYAKQAQFDKAVEFYKKAHDLGSTEIESLYNYGVCLFNLGKSKEALAIFEKLIQLDPQYADGYYQLGLVYLGLGNNAKAKEALNKFLELDPKNNNASVAKEILKSL